ncbi:MAG: glycosyltransferase [Aeriscardovia sp.]|nr:glycosyltransferase [Aeriscardovia sp.]
MPKLRFANIVLNDVSYNPQSCNSLYYLSNKTIVEQKDKSLRLIEEGEYDFTTYFNSLSIYKLFMYSKAVSFYLHIEIMGPGSEIERTYADNFSHNTQHTGEITKINQNQTWQTLDIPIIPGKEDVIEGFIIKTHGEDVKIRNCYWGVETKSQPEKVKLALVTPTFKKEEYIERNISYLKANFFADDIGKNSHFFVIDNGRTLNRTLGDKNISIIPNPNVGGSGGFARGMLEVLKNKANFTHVLLMDDDVSLCAESIKRTINLISILKPEWQRSFISGAMLNFDIKDMQREDVGWVTPQGGCISQKPILRMTLTEDLVLNETLEPSEEMKKNTYAAWWYCAMPVKIIEENGLPLPIFVRGDDAEYGFRAKPKFITMNSICTWHKDFPTKYSAVIDRYYTLRNTLCAQLATGFAPHSNFMAPLCGAVDLELHKFGYTNATFALEALEDFFRGPNFLANPDLNKKRFDQLWRDTEKFVDLDELQKQINEIPELRKQGFNVRELTRQIIDKDKPRSRREEKIDRYFVNKQRILQTNGEGFAVIPANGWTFPAGIIREKKYLVMVDWFNQKGCIRVKDVKKYEEISKRYKTDLHYYKTHLDYLKRIWRTGGKELTTPEFWEQYLAKAAKLY